MWCVFTVGVGGRGTDGVYGMCVGVMCMWYGWCMCVCAWVVSGCECVWVVCVSGGGVCVCVVCVSAVPMQRTKHGQ